LKQVFFISLEVIDLSVGYQMDETVISYVVRKFILVMLVPNSAFIVCGIHVCQLRFFCL